MEISRRYLYTIMAVVVYQEVNPLRDTENQGLKVPVLVVLGGLHK